MPEEYNGLVYVMTDSMKGTRDQKIIYSITTRLHLPLFLIQSTWMRYGYTYTDVHSTLQAYGVSTLWQMAYIYGIPCPVSNIKIGVSTPFSITYGSKVTVIRKIMNMVSKVIQLSTGTPVLEPSEHVPLIPTIYIQDNTVFNKMLECTILEYISCTRCRYKNKFKWADALFITDTKDEHTILANRIVEEYMYIKSGRTSTCLGNTPRTIIIGNATYIQVEEACLFKYHGP